MPTNRGFQSYTGYLQAQGDYYKHNVGVNQLAGALKVLDGLDFWKDTRPMFEAVGNYSLDLYRSALSKILNDYAAERISPAEREEHPLFIYMAHQTVHVPLQFRNDESNRCGRIEHSARRTYCNMMVELDDAIGEMVNQYKSLNLWDNTLVFVLTDNGGMVNFSPNMNDDNFPNFPASQGSNFPLRGSKTTLFEGGVRSMGFISGGKVPSEVRGHRFGGLAHAVDFSATILSAARILPLKRERLVLDGYDLMHLLHERPEAIQQRDHVPINIVSQGKHYSAVRFGKYKLIVNDFFSPPAQGWYDGNGDLHEASIYIKDKTYLFDLEKDPEEREDLAESLPLIVKQGLDIIEMYVSGGDYMEPQASTRVHAMALPFLHGGVWKPFMSKKDWVTQYEEDKTSQKKRYEKEEDMARLHVEEGSIRSDVATSWTIKPIEPTFSS